MLDIKLQRTLQEGKVDRLEQLRQIVDDILRRQPDLEERRCGVVHLYGVSAICALLALRRGQDAVLCATMGMLHDIATYESYHSPDHGPRSAREAERILGELGSYSADEIACIAQAISRHSAKDQVDGELDELLKDADALQHYLYNPVRFAGFRQMERVPRALRELGIE